MTRYMLTVVSCGAALCADPARFLDERHVYVRGEEVTFRLRTDAQRVSFDVSGWLAREVAVQGGEARFQVDTALLRAADYEVRGAGLRGGRRTGEMSVFPITIAAKPNPQRFPLWNWGGGHSPDVRWWAQRGFNGLRMAGLSEPLSAADYPRFERALEEGARYGMDMGAHFNPLRARRFQTEQTSVLPLLPDGARMRPARPGVLRPVWPYALEPAVIEHARKIAASWNERFASHPAYRYAHISSEVETPFCLNDAAVRSAKEEGIDLPVLLKAPWIVPGTSHIEVARLPPELQPKEGVIADDNPAYRFLLWWWQRGHGVAAMNAEAARVVKEKRPDVITWYDPYRLAPVNDTHIGLDMINTWTYGYPDIKRLLYPTVLQAAARRHHQKVMQDITMFVYGYFVMPVGTPTADIIADLPGRDPYFTQGPDYMREALWLVLSQRPDGVNFYYSSAAAPENPALDPHWTSPEAFDAIGEVSRTLIEPYGPALLESRRAKAKVAVLMSASAVWFPGFPGVPIYPTEQIMPFLALLAMNHVPFEVLLDDDVKAGALAGYDVLVIGRGDTLTQSVHRRIVEFAAAGKKVLADSTLRARIPGAIQTGFDFGFERDVNGRALARGKAVEGEAYRALMESYAERLKPLLADVARPAECESKRVILNTVESGDLKYVFAVNDDRTYGPRFGRFRLMLESGQRQTATIRLAGAEKAAVYDALRRKRIEYAVKDGRPEFQLTLPPSRGALVAVLPQAIGKVEVSGPGGCQRGRPCPLTVRVLAEGGAPVSGSVPLRVDLADPAGRQSEFSRFAATAALPASGEYAFTLGFLPAVNDSPGQWTVRVTELAGGSSVERKFAVQ